MCVCVWKPFEKEVSKETMRLCWDGNPQGAGYMWAEDGRVQIRKGFFKFRRFWKAYRRDISRIERAKSGVAIHFRISTSGLLDRKNCHPHRVSRDLAFIHNGILPLEVDQKSPVSDSVLFSDILRDLPAGWHNVSNLKVLVEMDAGRNKLVFLSADGNPFIVNEALGSWEDGVWYSNTHWKPFKPYKTGKPGKDGWWSYMPGNGTYKTGSRDREEEVKTGTGDGDKEASFFDDGPEPLDQDKVDAVVKGWKSEFDVTEIHH